MRADVRVPPTGPVNLTGAIYWGPVRRRHAPSAGVRWWEKGSGVTASAASPFPRERLTGVTALSVYFSVGD